MSESVPLFSQAASNAIRVLDPWRRPTGSAHFPEVRTWRDYALRVGDNEPLHAWFRRVVGAEEQASARIEQCAIEENMAFFARVCWDNHGIRFCCLQALVTTNGDLLDYYLDNKATQACYYRLDLDITQPGPLFAEPLPHCHCVPNGPPRFPFASVAGEYLPIAFLEFLYLNHFHDRWLQWVKAECALHGGDLEITDIAEAFREGRISTCPDVFGADLRKLRALLHKAKRQYMPNAPKLHPCILTLNYS